MGDGKIRITRQQDNWRDFSDYWALSMHDNLLGRIPAIRFSYDKKFMFSVGADGNLFSYSWNLPCGVVKQQSPPAEFPRVSGGGDWQTPN